MAQLMVGALMEKAENVIINYLKTQFKRPIHTVDLKKAL